MSAEEIDAVALERRLTTFEVEQREGFAGVNRRLDIQNGTIRHHNDWITAHDRETAHEKGFRAGALWVMGGVVGAAMGVVVLAGTLVVRVLFG